SAATDQGSAGGRRGSGRPGRGSRRLLRLLRYADDAIVVGTWIAPSVGVVREDPQFALWGFGDGAKPPELAGVARGGGTQVRQWHYAQSFAPKIGDVDRPGRHLDTAGAGLARAPLLDRVDEAFLIGLALHDGPAVVATGFDDVQLVPRVLPELAGIHRAVRGPGDPLHIAVAVAVEERTVEGVVRWDLSGGCHPQDLACQGTDVLGVLR